MQSNQQSLDDLEQLLAKGIIEANKAFAKHGDCLEIRTLRRGLAHVEESIAQLRSDMLNQATAIKDNEEQLKINILDGLNSIEGEIN